MGTLNGVVKVVQFIAACAAVSFVFLLFAVVRVLTAISLAQPGVLIANAA